MTPGEAGQMAVWGVVVFCGMMWFTRWANRPASPNSMEWAGSEAERELEARQFASHYNKLHESALPQISGDYDDGCCDVGPAIYVEPYRPKSA